MQGVIIIVGRTQSMILGDDGTRYSFPTLDWQNDDISPKIGVRVSFEAQGPQAMPQAMDVRPITDTAVSDTEPDAASDPGQRGTIRRVARADRPGVIEGEDGAEYTYMSADWQIDSFNPIVGMRVGFTARGSSATSVRLPGRPPQTSGSANVSSSRAPGLSARVPSDPEEAVAPAPVPSTTAPDTSLDAASDLGQRGTIRRVARADRPGVIEGEDGAEYTYMSADWQIDSFNPIAGMRVGFTARGSSATSVRLPGRPPQPSGSANVSSSRTPGLSPRASSDSGETVAPASVPSATVSDTDRDAASDLNLQGTIQRVARTDLPGVIQGDDGVQYIYTTADWQFDSFRTYAGERVNFLGRGSSATSVQPIRFHIRKTRRRIPKKVIVLALLVFAAVGGVALLLWSLPPTADYWTTYAGAYARQIDANFSTNYAHAYAEQIDAGFPVSYARAYAQEIDAGKSPTYARAFATHIAADSSEEYARAYAEQLDTGYLHWYAHEYAMQIDDGKSPRYASAYAKQLDAGFSALYAYNYAQEIDSGKSHAYARAYADTRYVAGLSEEHARGNAEEANSESSLAAVIVLAMYSTTDDAEADRRAASAREITTYLGRGDMDNDTALGLLAHIVPGASIDERVEAASRLASISDDGDGELTPEQTMEVANELTRLITGHGIDAEQRAGAAREMVRLSQSGELNADNAAELMDTIAPEWSITERKEALGYLAWQFSEGDWDADSAQRTAEEGYTLITGGEIQIERRVEATVELVGEGLKRYGGDSYDDEGVDQAVALTQGAIRGDLTMDSISNILGFDSDDSSTDSSNPNPVYLGNKSDEFISAYKNSLRQGKSEKFARAYARRIDAGKSWCYAHIYAGQFARGNSALTRHIATNAYQLPCPEDQQWDEVEQQKLDSYVRNYIEQIVDGKPAGYARTYAEGLYHDRAIRNIEDSIGNIERRLESAKRDGDSEDIEEYEGELKDEHVKRDDRRAWAHTYAEQIGAGKSSEYAGLFTIIRFGSISENIHELDKRAHAFAHYDYLHHVTDVYHYFGFEIYVYASHGRHDIYTYTDQITAGKSPGYARIYTKYKRMYYSVELEGFSHAYAKQIFIGKSSEYASVYAWLLNLHEIIWAVLTVLYDEI